MPRRGNRSFEFNRWDAAGLLCLATLAVSLGLLRREVAVSQAAEAVALAPGAEIQAGDEWIGLYFQDRKIGLTRVTKTAEADGTWKYRVHSTLKLESLGVPAQAELDLHAHLGSDRALQRFELSLTTGAQAFRGEGRVEGRRIALTLITAGERVEKSLEVDAPPVLRDLLGPALAREPLTPGRRLTLPGFDPWTLSASPLEIEIIGPEPLILMGSEVAATRIRQRVEGLTLDAWINDRGEMLRQELPLGLVALRQSEEEARWGLAGDSGLSLADSVELPVAAIVPPPAQRSRLALRLDGDAPREGLHRPPAQVLEGDRLTRTAEVVGQGLARPVEPRRDGEFRAALGSDAVLQADHPTIRAAAAAHLGGAKDTVAAARALMGFLRAEMRFERRGGIPSALETLKAMAGDCTETSVLFAALARAAGVPTRIVFGLVYKDAPKPRFAWHAWNEVAVADGQWLSVDATWGQIPVDVGHIALVSGDLSRQAELLRVMGHLRIQVFDTP